MRKLGSYAMAGLCLLCALGPAGAYVRPIGGEITSISATPIALGNLTPGQLTSGTSTVSFTLIPAGSVSVSLGSMSGGLFNASQFTSTVTLPPALVGTDSYGQGSFTVGVSVTPKWAAAWGDQGGTVVVTLAPAP